MCSPDKHIHRQDPPSTHVVQVHRCCKLGKGQAGDEDIEDYAAEDLSSASIQHALRGAQV